MRKSIRIILIPILLIVTLITAVQIDQVMAVTQQTQPSLEETQSWIKTKMEEDHYLGYADRDAAGPSGGYYDREKEKIRNVRFENGKIKWTLINWIAGYGNQEIETYLNLRELDASSVKVAALPKSEPTHDGITRTYDYEFYQVRVYNVSTKQTYSPFCTSSKDLAYRFARALAYLIKLTKGQPEPF